MQRYCIYCQQSERAGRDCDWQLSEDLCFNNWEQCVWLLFKCLYNPVEIILLIKHNFDKGSK